MYCYTLTDNNVVKRLYNIYPMPKQNFSHMPEDIINFKSADIGDGTIAGKYDKVIPDEDKLNAVRENIYSNIQCGLEYSNFDSDIAEAINTSLESTIDYVYYKRTHDNEGHLKPEYIKLEHHDFTIKAEKVPMVYESGSLLWSNL